MKGFLLSHVKPANMRTPDTLCRIVMWLCHFILARELFCSVNQFFRCGVNFKLHSCTQRKGSMGGNITKRALADAGIDVLARFTHSKILTGKFVLIMLLSHEHD